ncbi:hypothetical protein KM043_018713 [Ampulex compressa]|nr:hypothetical protein KM043_018713 [Ampulex compressa]
MIRRAENGAENSPSTSAMPAPAPSRAKPRVVSNVRLEWAYVGTAIDAQRTTTATAAGITGTTVTGRRHRDILEGLARFARRRSSGSGATPPLTKSKIPVATGVVRGGLQSIAPSTLTKPPGAPAPSKGLAETTTITSKRQGPSVTSPNSGPSRAARTLPPNNVEPVTLETTHAPVAEGRSMPLIPKNTPPSPGEPACSAVVALTTETIAVSVPRTSPSPRISADTGEGEISSVTPTTPRSPTIPPAPRRNAAHGLSEATEEAANRWSPVPLRSGFRRQRPDFAVAASRARTDPSATPRARPRDTGPTTTSAGNMLRAVALQPAPSTVQTPPRGQTSAGVAAPYTRPDGGVCQGPVPRSLPRREDTAISPRMIEATTQTDETQ